MRFAFGAVLLLLIQGCAQQIQKPAADNQTIPQQPSVQTKPAAPGFEPVKIMLSTNCAPCHNPGGKMYERLPFDNAEVVRTHSSPILGRLKKPEDKKLLEDWLS